MKTLRKIQRSAPRPSKVTIEVTEAEYAAIEARNGEADYDDFERILGSERAIEILVATHHEQEIEILLPERFQLTPAGKSALANRQS